MTDRDQPMFHVKHRRGQARSTMKAAHAKLVRGFLYHERWYPTTYDQPPHDRPYGAIKAQRST